MRRYAYTYILLVASLLLPTACAVHQWPAAEEVIVEDVELRLNLDFHPDMTLWEHYYDIETNTLTEIATETPTVYDNTQTTGFIRYIVRVYPITERSRAADWHLQEYIFTSEFTGGDYDYETEIKIPAGEYRIMAWADIGESEWAEPRYDAGDFAQVVLVDHSLSTDYRDAFRGVGDVTLVQSRTPAVTTLHIDMRRPLAKCEIIAEGLEDFIQNNPTRNDISGYRVILAYTGYTPFAYSAVTDLLVDSRYGEQFETVMTPIDSSSVSLGFDYHFVRTEDSSTRLQVAVFDSAGEEIAMSEPVQIPLRRDYHTVIRGKFLSANASGGFVGVDPSFSGEFNVIK